ncbi:hypothetical protein [Sporosarcina ureae]|uniref:hypothetical protein n=1 Tax=Sporosarcina ureae TaxID=1571 RepID=UPI000A17C361|nr:hypothetical protein [Sporosarcina ureae]ARK22059.1 hypothetical protein SporoP32a_11335 [Sporosarcina ureae]
MTSNTSFKTSVNIKFDIGNKEFLDRYLPTPSHAESLIGLATGFVEKGASTSHIMIGPYGSGKSLIASIIASIVSKSVSLKTIDKLTHKFEKVHQDIFEVISKLPKVEKIYLPVTLSGYEGSFSEAVITAINRELKKHNIDANLSSDEETVVTIIQKWENEYPHTYEQFSSIVKQKKNLNVKQWLDLFVLEMNHELEWFKEIYPRLTAGATYKADNSQLFLEKIEALLEILEEKNIGIFLVYDEFGRFLQTLKSDEIYKTMQDIQDLAEIASRSKGLLHLLLVSHKSMAQYMLTFNEEYKSEFQRIEKRFNSYFVESDTATYYRIAEQYTSQIVQPSIFTLEEFGKSVAEVRKFNLFDELNQQEVEKVIVEGAFPIHPVALFMLPRISKVFGQNERTLFTFLESKDSGGLINHISKSDNYYYTHKLFDFFFNQKLENDYDDEVFKSFYLYKKVTSNISRNNTNEKLYQILRFITLWELSNSNSVYKLDNELIAFSTGILLEEVNEILESASNSKFIRYNRILEVWELNEGSSVIVDELIDENKTFLKLNNEKRTQFMEGLLKKQYYLANEYNDRKSMTRFMKVKLVSSADVLNENIVVCETEIEDADGYIYFVLLDKVANFELVKDKVSSYNSERIMFSIIKDPFSKIQPLIDKELVVASLLTNKKILSEYALLEEELLVLQEELLHEVSGFLSQYVDFSREPTWILNGQNVHIYDDIDLENRISDIMEKHFGQMPLILNEAVNRMHVNGMQQNALYKVLNGILVDFDKENLGIEGQGPDYLIYATVLKNNKINLTDLNHIENVSLNSIRYKLLEEITSNPKGNLKELVDIMIKPPFGIRKPLVPLLFVMLLRDRWDQLMFYRNDMFVSTIEAEKVYAMFDNYSNYQYEFHHYSEDLLSFMEDVESVVKDYISDNVKDRTLLIKACSGLLNWLRQLPRVTQITDAIPENEKTLRELIRRTEISPLESMKEIHSLCEGDIQTIEKSITVMGSFFARFKIYVTNQLIETLAIENFEEKAAFVENIDRKKVAGNRLLTSIIAVQNIDQFVEEYIGISLENWSDTTLELYQQQLKNDYESFTSENSQVQLNEDMIQLNYNDVYKQIEPVELSTKSKVVFNNVDRMLKSAGRNISKKELNYIMYKLLDKYLE